MKEIKVSVIVPVHNTEKYLHECIDSICNQTLKEIEIILVNDGSTDGSLSILEEYAKKDARVIVTQNQYIGQGAGSARNHGLELATGKYLSFLDSDDYFDLTMLEMTYNKAQQCNAEIVSYDAFNFNDATNEMIPRHNVSLTSLSLENEVFNHTDLDDFLFYATSVPWMSLFKHDFIRENDLHFQHILLANDFFFVQSAYALAKRIVHMPVHLAYHRRFHQVSLMTNAAKTPTAILLAAAALKESLEQKGLFQKLKSGFAARVIMTSKFHSSMFTTIDAIHALFDALQNEYIEKLELETAKTAHLLPFDGQEWLQTIKNGDKAKYIFELKQLQNPNAFSYHTNFFFPHKQVKKEDRVILYGAGNIGTAFFMQNMKLNHCNLVAWVDKNPENKQIPVTGLDALKTVPCDKVIIAIDSAVVFKEMSQYLVEIGFKKEQIINGIQTEES